MIVTCRAVCDATGLQVGLWKDRVSIRSIADGTSHTILAGEMHIPAQELNRTPFNGPLFNGQELDSHTRIGGPGVPLLTPADEALGLFGFGSAHPGTTGFVFSDGSTLFMKNSMDTVLLGNLCHRDDGQIPADDN